MFAKMLVQNVTVLYPYKSKNFDANIFSHNSPADWARELFKPCKDAEWLEISI